MRFSISTAVIAMFLATGVACNSLPSRQFAIPDVRPQREVNQQAAIESFEQKRNSAELSAARLRMQQGDLPACIEMLKASLARRPEHRDALLMLAEAELHAGEVEAAKRSLGQILAQNGEDADAHHALGMLYEATQQEQLAQTHFEQALHCDPQNALFQITAGENHERASCTVEPDDTAMALSTAVRLLREGQHERAVAILTDCVNRCPGQPKVLQTLATAHLNVGDCQAAQVLLQQAVSLDNTDALSYFLLGHALAEQGNTLGADESFRRAETLDPRFRRPS